MGFGDGVVENLEVKLVPPKSTGTKLWLSSYGTYDCGGELIRLAWSKMKHVFSIRRRNEIQDPDQGIVEAVEFGPGDGGAAGTPRLKVLYQAPDISHNVLWKNPVDLFVIECCSRYKPPPPNQPERWEVVVSKTKVDAWPKVVLESWDVRCNTWANGPTEKGSIT